jgi:hypothetical protein
MVTSAEAFADAATAYREGRFGKASSSDLPKDDDQRADDRSDSSPEGCVSHDR